MSSDEYQRLILDKLTFEMVLFDIFKWVNCFKSICNYFCFNNSELWDSLQLRQMEMAGLIDEIEDTEEILLLEELRQVCLTTFFFSTNYFKHLIINPVIRLYILCITILIIYSFCIRVHRVHKLMPIKTSWGFN